MPSSSAASVGFKRSFWFRSMRIRLDQIDNGVYVMIPLHTVVNGLVVIPIAPWWFRGPVRREGEWIVAESATLTPYDPSDDVRIGVELSRLRSAEDALLFVERYGLLSAFASAKDDKWLDRARAAADELRLERRHLKSELQRTTATGVFRERVDDLLSHAQLLADAIRFVHRARAATTGDHAALSKLEKNKRASLANGTAPLPVGDTLGEFFRRHWLETRQRRITSVFANSINEVPADVWISRYVASALNDRVEGARPYLRTVGGGQFELRLLTATLLDFCYVGVAYALAERPLGLCPECGRSFLITDKRQRFCEPRCADRARFKAWKRRQRHQSRKRGSHVTSKSARRRVHLRKK